MESSILAGPSQFLVIDLRNVGEKLLGDLSRASP